MKHGKLIFREWVLCGKSRFRSGSGMKAIQAAIQEACKEKTERTEEEESKTARSVLW